MQDGPVPRAESPSDLRRTRASRCAHRSRRGSTWQPASRTPPTPRRSRVTLAASVALNLAVALAVLTLLALGVGPRTGEYRTLTMLTGSMVPQFPVGSVVVVTPEPVDSLRPGQVITYRAPVDDRRVVTHRVVSVDRSGPKPVITTKGDANAGVDPWQAVISDQVIWRARGTVPYLGSAIRTLREPLVQVAFTRALPVALLGWLLLAVWRPARAS